MKDPLIFIEHIIENIENVETFSKDLTKEDLSKNKLKQYAIIRAIEIIGEAAKNLSTKFKEENSGIPWREIAGARDRIIHHYFGADLDIIWEIIKRDIPELKKKMVKIKGSSH